MDEQDIQLWKTKRLLKFLREASGNGTSMVSFILRPGESIAKANQKLTEEYGTASNIKSRVNRQSVESAIVSAQQRLKLYSKCPKNGLCIFSGEVTGADGKTKRVVIDFEPFKPINTTLYLCDNRFHIEPLEEILLDEKTFAFVIVDGDSYTLATLCGNTQEILDHDDVNLPSKTRRGGQSSNRFARLREIARNEWVKDVCEMMKVILIDGNLIGKIEGIILAGNSDIKHNVKDSAALDARIKSKIRPTLYDVPYGGKQGLKHAINLSKEELGSVKFVAEQSLLDGYFEKIAKDENVSYGLKDTMKALEESAVEKLILFEKLATERCTVEFIDKDSTLITEVRYLDADKDPAQGERIVTKEPLIDWLVEHHKDFGADISFVSDCTAVGSQFAKGFGGIGAILRYKVDFTDYGDEVDDVYLDDDDYI